ncbi:MAG: DUF362 domain-containing protein [Acidobacteria bacterium]|nr:DUF362 domain-containing protein [Acidobacteriota bacterium]
MNRRRFLPTGAAALLAGCSKTAPQAAVDHPVSPVFAARVERYGEALFDTVRRGFEACGLNVRGLRVLLKPNLVEFDPDTPVNTNPAVVAAAAEWLQSEGADVVFAEGPGHRRDTFEMTEAAGYFEAIPHFESRFVDLNLDEVAHHGELGTGQRLYLPKSILGADLVVSIAKMKTHHWAGVTLSMKNLFGIVPGAVYGWPKNALHYNGLTPSILTLNHAVPKMFSIVDGILAMEGNGPIQGQPVPAGVLVMGQDRVAVDATCCRLMAIDPTKVDHLAAAAALGNIAAEKIEQRGDTIHALARPFNLMPEFGYLRPGTRG